MPKILKLFLVLLLVFLSLNLLYLDYLFLSKNKKEGEIGNRETSGEKVELNSESRCGSCAALIDERIAEVAATVSAGLKKSSAPNPPVPNPPASSSIKVTSYLSLGSGGSTQKSDWTRVDGSEFTFDLGDYAEGAKVYWEGNLKAQYTNSRCYARLFDKTNSRAVDFSEQSTDQTTNQYLTSQELMIWFGKLKYQLEIKSLNGITCYLDSPRLVVKY